ncbi:MAG: OmpA family protein [Gemmatimonadota bacterium]|nr:OmpA family protein [Gemmatimonadota bacterium]
MSTIRWTSPRLAMMAGLGMVGLTSACSTVSPDELDSDLSALRAEMMEEMEAGDEQVTQEMDGRLSSIEQRLSQLESDLSQMERDFEVTVQRLEEQLRFDVPVYFGFDDATLTADARPILDRFAAVAEEYYPEALITVEGFTDPSGPAEYNQQLGQRRADTVRDYLVQGASVGDERVRAVSYGENSNRLVQPDETGPGQTGWQNRRVVLVIDHQGEPPTVSTEEQQGSTE